MNLASCQYHSLEPIITAHHCSMLCWEACSICKGMYQMGEGASQVAGTSGKEPASQCRRWKRCRFNPWAGRSPGGGHGNPLQDSCLENPTNRGAWQNIVHRVAKSQTWVRQLSMHACMDKMDPNFTYYNQLVFWGVVLTFLLRGPLLVPGKGLPRTSFFVNWQDVFALQKKKMKVVAF